MITPRFRLSQDKNNITIVIRAPYCSLKDLDVNVEDHVFIFSCPPYYLRLHFSGQIEEDDSSRGSFNSDNGEFTFTYKKVNEGEDFPDLNFVTKFLCPKVEVEDGGHKIEVLTSSGNMDENTEIQENNIQYGFAMRGGYNCKLIGTEFTDVFEVDPLAVTLDERCRLRHQVEQKQFDIDHYLADLFDNDEIKELIGLSAPWEKFSKTTIQFSSKELDFLKDLPNINYKLNEIQIKYCYNSLLEILYAYCYDCRTTYFDTTCESGWTISKLSASLCWFDGFITPKQALICAFRRSLIYPLYRNFDLCMQVLEDLKNLVILGEQFIIKCLINIYDIFLNNDVGRYILNNLFIKDYIVYIMKWDKDLWLKTVQDLQQVIIEKKDLGLNLLQIELLTTEDDAVTVAMANLNIKDSCADSDDLTSSSSDSESDEESDSSDDNEEIK